MPPLPLLAKTYSSMTFYNFYDTNNKFPSIFSIYTERLIHFRRNIYICEYWYHLQQYKLIWEFCFINCFRCHLSFALNFYLVHNTHAHDIMVASKKYEHNQDTCLSHILQLIVSATCTGLQCNNNKWVVCFIFRNNLSGEYENEKKNCMEKSEENSLKIA